MVDFVVKISKNAKLESEKGKGHLLAQTPLHQCNESYYYLIVLYFLIYNTAIFVRLKLLPLITLILMVPPLRLAALPLVSILMSQ